MTFDEFEQSLEQAEAPAGLGPLPLALWLEARGRWRDSDWDQAHRIVQAESGRDAERVHAYLHRREGDLGNAGYWYSRAGAEPRSDDLANEWADLARELL